MNYTEKKQLLEEFTEGLEILFLKRGRGSKIYSSDLDRTLKFFTQSINRVEKAERERVWGMIKKIRNIWVGEAMDADNEEEERYILKIIETLDDIIPSLKDKEIKEIPQFEGTMEALDKLTIIK